MNVKISKIVKHPPINCIIDQGASYWVTVDLLNEEERSERLSIDVLVDDKENFFLTKDIESMALHKARLLLDSAISSIEATQSS